jgi:hypothetical protein
MDLVVLTADKNMQFALNGALRRSEALGIRPIQFRILVHSERDGGARTTGPDLLALQTALYDRCLLILDHEGCGAEDTAPNVLEQSLDGRLSNHWGDRAKSIVVAPEFDLWMWGSDNSLSQVFDWPIATPIRDWLSAKGFQFDGNGKPLRPKECLEAIQAVHRIPRSSALYENIATQISLARCTDASFARMRAKLQEWFPTG